MSRGEAYLKEIIVWIGQQDNIAIQFFKNGQAIDFTGATAHAICEFNGTTKFNQLLTEVDASVGKFVLTGVVDFDEAGDWLCSCRIVDGGNTVFSEQFLFVVKKPTGS